MSNAEKIDKEKLETPSVTSTGTAHIGRLLGGKYRILEKLGNGGMGVVYKAEHTLVDRIVAIKILHAHLLSDDTFLKRFHREAKVGCKINHQNAVTIWDFGVEDHLPYIVMEYVQGTTLKQILFRDGALALDRCARIFRQMGSALSAAHELGIIHRDLKPDNVMLTREGLPNERAQVLDFGIAKLLTPITGSDGVLATRAGTLMGTPAYLSPEQALEKDLDARSDIYSLGIILYEMLSGDVPFRSTSPIEVCVQHVQAVPSRLCEFKPELKIPVPVCNVVMKALSKDPSERFQNVEEMVRAFESALNGGERIPVPKAVKPTRKPMDWSWVKKRHIVGTSVAILCLAVGAYVGMGGKSKTAPLELAATNQTVSEVPEPAPAAVVQSELISEKAPTTELSEPSKNEPSEIVATDALQAITPEANVETEIVVPFDPNASAPKENETAASSASSETTLSANELQASISSSSQAARAALSETQASSASVIEEPVVESAQSSSLPDPLSVPSLEESQLTSLREPVPSFEGAKSKGLNNKSSVLFRNAERQLDNKQYLEAATLFRQVVEQSPGHLQSRLNFGVSLMRLGLLEQAIEQYQQAIKIDAEYAPSHYSLASAYALGGKNEEAFAALNSAKKHYPGVKKWLSDDPDFNSLRSDERFAEYAK